jgi:WS/DGAT/MGAT family acyltransferase
MHRVTLQYAPRQQTFMARAEIFKPQADFEPGGQWMENLGLMDHLFYKAEQYQVANMVMGGASILRPARASTTLDAQKLAGHIAARLEKIPLLRHKFVQDPLRLGSVHKVEDPEFDVDKHIHVETLPEPGGYGELTHAIGEIASRPLDSKDLWRWTLLEGLEDGGVAMVCQMHHAMFDGLGAMQVLSSMYDSKPVKLEKPCGLPQQSAYEPSPYALLGDAVAETTRRAVIKTPQFLRKNTLPIMGALASGTVNLLKQGREALDSPEVKATSLNTQGSSGQRAVAYKTLSLPEIKALARQHQCTVNDLGLLLFSYALEHYFHKTEEQVDFDLWCGMPISTRTDSSTAGNQVTTARINLHNTIDDPIKRLQAIHEDAQLSKQAARPEDPVVDAGDLAELVSPLLVDGLMFLSGQLRLLERLSGSYTMANALLSNVPGPRDKMYIGNSFLAETIPLIPAVDVLALSGGISSVGDTITLGFHCDREAVPDPDLLVEGVEAGLSALSTQ